MPIIDFAEAKKALVDHDHAVEAAETLLDRFQRDLFTSALNIATSGVWRDWNTSVAEGTVMEFDPETLMNCGDSDVVQLIGLVLSIEDIQLSGDQRPGQDQQ